MRLADYSAVSTTRTPIDIPPRMRLRRGKFCGAANAPSGNSEIHAPPRARICSESREFFPGINHIHARAKHGDSFGFCRDRAALAGRFDAPRRAPDHGQPLRRQIARRPLGPIRNRRMARSHHSDAGLGHHFGVAAHAENEWRIVDFSPARRICRVVHRGHGDVDSGGVQSVPVPVPPTSPWLANARKPLGCQCSQVRSTTRAKQPRRTRGVRPACAPS